MRPALRTARTLGAIGLAGAAAGLGWARLVEPRCYTLREATAAVLPQGAPSLRLLHISDIHLMPQDRRKLDFLRRLAALDVDLVVDTGDNIASAASIDPLIAAIGPLLARPGAFVMGSNDMYAPRRKNPLRYLLPDARPEGFVETLREPDLPTARLASQLSSGGWADLTNSRAMSRIGGIEVAWVGVDDPHLERDRMPAPQDAGAGGAGQSAAQHTDAGQAAPVVRIAVAHAPYRRVLDAFVADGADLILSGHTHGGQLRVPGFGALVTNCDLPRARAKGLSSWEGVPLHVSGGMGANPYTNVRFANPPEATLLTLTQRPG